MPSDGSPAPIQKFCLGSVYTDFAENLIGDIRHDRGDLSGAASAGTVNSKVINNRSDMITFCTVFSHFLILGATV